jgi:hypothetical protein
MFSWYEQFVNYMSVQSLKAAGTIDEAQANNLQTYLDNDRILSYGQTPIEVSKDVIDAADKKIQTLKTVLKYMIYGAVIVGGVVIFFKVRQIIKSTK